MADFHALRHTFITNLVKAGVQPKDAKELARHSTSTLTLDRCAHVELRDSAEALSKLTLPTLPMGQTKHAREQQREQQGAATGAAEAGNDGEPSKTGEETTVAALAAKRLGRVDVGSCS